MPWFYNSLSGELANESGFSALAYEAAIHSGTGWHELHISGSASFAQAAAEAKKEVPGGASPTGSFLGGLGNTGSGITNTAGNLTGINAVGDFFSRLTEKGIWVRVGEVLAGVLILYVGLKAVTAPQGASARQIANHGAKSTVKRVAKVVVK